MICSCERPLDDGDNDCLKCGRELAAHAELVRIFQEAWPVAKQYGDALEKIGYWDEIAAAEAAHADAPTARGRLT